LPTQRILLVEDNEELREIIGADLRARGHTVQEAGDTESALTALDGQSWDIVVTDVMLGQGSGLTLAQNALARTPPVPVLVASDPGFERSALALPGASFIAKPFGMAALIEALERTLAATRA
jgi:DNA-binding response OmpR family regulator